MEEKRLTYGDKDLRAARAEDGLWLAMRDVASLLGQKNPRQMANALHGKAEERVLEARDKHGRVVLMVHLSAASVRALILKSKIGNKEKLLTWLDNVVKERMPDAAPATLPPAQIASGNRKPARKTRAVLIEVRDYVELMNRSKSTVYDLVKAGKLRKQVFGEDSYIWITERDEGYAEILAKLETAGQQIGAAAEWKCTILGRKN